MTRYYLSNKDRRGDNVTKTQTRKEQKRGDGLFVVAVAAVAVVAVVAEPLATEREGK